MLLVTLGLSGHCNTKHTSLTTLRHRSVPALPSSGTYQPSLVVGGGAVGAAHGVVLPQRSVQLRQLSQLHAPQVVLTLWHLHALPDHLLDLLDDRTDYFRTYINEQN